MTRLTLAAQQRAVTAGLTEKLWQQQVLDIAHLYGWRSYHTHDSRRSTAGYPDLTLIRPPRLVFAELKSMRGRISTDQQQWLDELHACPGVEAYLWRPDQLEQVAAVLRPERRA
jgi:hypothetical protein